MAAVRLSLFNTFLLLPLFLVMPLQAETTQIQLATDSSEAYLAKIELHTLEELTATLLRAESWAKTHQQRRPIAFVLHGDEARVLLRDNSLNQDVQSLAQRLSENKVIEVQVCRTWMLFNGFKQDEFADFVSTVPYAPSEIERLLKQENYTYF